MARDAFPNPNVEMIESDGLDDDQDLSRTNIGRSNLLPFQNFAASMPSDTPGSHALPEQFLRPFRDSSRGKAVFFNEFKSLAALPELVLHA